MAVRRRSFGDRARAPPDGLDGSVTKRTIGLAMAFPGFCKGSNRQLVCGEIAGSQSHVAREPAISNLRDEGGDDGLRQLFLNGEHVLQQAIVTLGPDMAAGQGIDQLAPSRECAFRHAGCSPRARIARPARERPGGRRRPLPL